MYPINDTILIPQTKGIAVINISSIIRIEALSSYSKLFLSDGRQILVSKVLKQMEEMLAGKGFTRVHRSHLVNTACIQKYNLYQLKILLHNKEEIVISRRKKRDIRKKFSEQREVYLRSQKVTAAA